LLRLSILSQIFPKIGASTFFPNSFISAPARKVLSGAVITIALIFSFKDRFSIVSNSPILTAALIALTGGLEISISAISSIILYLTTYILSST
jgi:hypothetical protein